MSPSQYIVYGTRPVIFSDSVAEDYGRGTVTEQAHANSNGLILVD